MREEWWTIAIHYPDGVGGARSFSSRAEAEAAARENERLGYGHGDEKMRGRMKISHVVKVTEDWVVSGEHRTRIDAEDAAYEAKRPRTRARTQK